MSTQTSNATPDAEDAATPPLDAARRAEARRSLHYVTSHGTNRVCATEGCDTKLSRYNKATHCWIHDDAGR